MTSVEFHLYADGNPTGVVKNSLQAAKNAATGLIAARKVVRIQAASSLATYAVWEFDYSIDRWIRQL